MDAARRELREETGIEAESLALVAGVGGEDFRHVYPNGDRVEYHVFVYRCVAEGSGEPTDRVEVRARRFFDRAEAPTLRLPYSDSLLWGASPVP